MIREMPIPMEGDPLTPNERIAITMDQEGRRIQDIKKALGISLSATYSTRWSARKKMGITPPPRKHAPNHGGKEDAWEPKCLRCELRGHFTEDCDLPTSAAAFVGQRRVSPMEIEH